MTTSFARAIAFVVEGNTEKVFYLAMLRYFCQAHATHPLETRLDPQTGEVYYTIRYQDNCVLVKINVVGAVAHITRSYNWFESRCRLRFKSLQWTVFLCYDTDNYKADISKFYKGDWNALRKQMGTHGCKVIDLAASADIEDIMLLDKDNIFKFLEMEPVDIPVASKGKRKMKKLFRAKGPKFAYHEGERAEPLVARLDMGTIIGASEIPFHLIEDALFGLLPPQP